MTTVRWITVPGRPVPKGRPRLGRNGQTYTPKRTKDHELLIRQWAMVERIQPIDGPVSLTCWFYLPDLRRFDGDNGLKLVADALQPPRGVPAGRGNAYADDSQVVRWHAEVELDRANPRTVIRVEAVE